MHIGVIGCGVIAHFHIPHLLRLGMVESVSLADPDGSRARGVAQKYRLRHLFPDLETMLREKPPDAVHILTPPGTHAKLAIRAMESGCHVLVEKPMALRREETEAMIAAAAAREVHLCVNHNLLFGPVISRLRRWREDGSFGRILHVEVRFGFDISRTGHIRDPKNWVFQLPGGPITDYLPHPVSLLLAFLKKPATVSALAKCHGRLPGGVADELRVLVDSDQGTGLASVSLGAKPDCITIDIYGTEMSAHANLSSMSLVRRRQTALPRKVARAADSLIHAAQLFASTAINTVGVLSGRVAPPGDVGELIGGFYRGIQTGNRPPVTGEEGRRVVGLMNEIWEKTGVASGREGMPQDRKLRQAAETMIEAAAGRN